MMRRRAQARAMAGEKAVALSKDRTNILIAAAAEVEEYVGRLFYRGLAGSARACTTVLELDAPGDAPMLAQFPSTDPAIVTAVALWDDAAAAFQASDFLVRPVGMVRLPTAGTYRITASATPSHELSPRCARGRRAAVRLSGNTPAATQRRRDDRLRAPADASGRHDALGRGGNPAARAEDAGVRAWLGAGAAASTARHPGAGCGSRRARRRVGAVRRAAVGRGRTAKHITSIPWRAMARRSRRSRV